MKAIEFNIQYDGMIVQLEIVNGMFAGAMYNTVTCRNQTWTNSAGVTMVDVMGLASSVKLSDCNVVKATKVNL